MNDVFFSASIIASFLAGMVALFAPCCITVLLPTYLASVFKKRTEILKMTLIFFFGMAVVLIPIGLGAAALAQVFSNFHKEMYIVGGLFMLLIAINSWRGKGMAILPMSSRLNTGGSQKSIFFLGIFSGAATSCCAPVLAGAVTLAIVSASFWKALIVVFAYIFGMTFPLFITAYLYDRFHWENLSLVKGKILSWQIGKRTYAVHSTNLIAGLVFASMGLSLLVLASRGDAFWSQIYQVKIGQALNKWSQGLLPSLVQVPDLVWGLAILLIFIYFLKRVTKK